MAQIETLHGAGGFMLATVPNGSEDVGKDAFLEAGATWCPGPGWVFRARKKENMEKVLAEHFQKSSSVDDTTTKPVEGSEKVEKKEKKEKTAKRPRSPSPGAAAQEEPLKMPKKEKTDPEECYIVLEDKPNGQKRVSLSTFSRKTSMIDVREFYKNDGEWKPTQKGLPMTLEVYNKMREHIDDMEQTIEQQDDGKFFELGNNRRFTFSKFKGKGYVGVREFYDAGGEMKPGKKGCNLPVDVYRKLISDAVHNAIMGWLK